jgi:hypothetical protein
MLYKKDKITLRVNHGKAFEKIGPLRGRIENIVIHPKAREYVIYNFKVLDSEEDEIFFEHNIVGKYRRDTCFPAGKSYDEHMTLVIDNASHNIDFDIIILTKER